MPFKGDENMLDDSAKNRAAMDEDEGEADLLFGVGAGAGDAAGTQDSSKKADNATGGGDGNLLDLNLMLGTSPDVNQNQIQNSGLLDLIGGGPQMTN